MESWDVHAVKRMEGKYFYFDTATQGLGIAPAAAPTRPASRIPATRLYCQKV